MSTFNPAYRRFVVLDDRTVADVALLKSLSTAYAREFCRIALEFIQKGPNKRLYQAAAGTVGAPAEAVERGVLGLAQLLLEATKAKLRQDELEETLAELEFSAEVTEEVVGFFLQHSETIAATTDVLAMPLPQYRHLDWRLDMELATRSLHSQVQPNFIFRLDLQNSGVEQADQSITMQSDYANLRHLQTALEAAAAEMKNTHCQRISRYIQ